MKYKAIIFDMDGTIIESGHIWKQVVKQMIEKRGHTVSDELSEELERQLSGVALPESCRKLKEIMRFDDDVHALVQEKRDGANQLYHHNVRYINGFIDFHKQATAMNFKVGLATNADQSTVTVTNQALNLEQFFGAHMYNISHVAQPKPKPDIYLHTAAQLGIEPDQCIAIEDSPHGLQAALHANMFCIGINTARRPDDLAESHLIIDEYSQIDLNSILATIHTRHR